MVGWVKMIKLTYVAPAFQAVVDKQPRKNFMRQAFKGLLPRGLLAATNPRFKNRDNLKVRLVSDKAPLHGFPFSVQLPLQSGGSSPHLGRNDG
jgi:hypothetical protein